jgi:hypothetical protein
VDVVKYIHRTPAFEPILKSQFLKHQVWLSSGAWLADYSGAQNYFVFDSGAEAPLRNDYLL